MSINSSLPEGDSGGAANVNAKANANANTVKPKQLTPQQLREQRRVRFETKGGAKKDASCSNRSSSSSEPMVGEKKNLNVADDLNYLNTAQQQQPSLSASTDQTEAIRIAALAEKEEQDLLVALRLSMGLPIADADAVIEPLQVNETTASSQHESISSDLLATAAVVAATSNAIHHTPSMQHQQQQQDDEDTKMVMSISDNDNEDDRKPAAKPNIGSSPNRRRNGNRNRIPKTNPNHFSGRVRTWYETASSYKILDFHDCMWDKGVTTQHDQKRWLAQGIQFKINNDNENDNNDDSTKEDPAAAITTKNPALSSSSLLETILSGPGGELL